MVLESTVKKHSFLRYVGAFSVLPKSKTIFESLDYAIELLKDPNNLVIIFPQGHIQSAFISEIKMQKGIKYIIEKGKTPFQYLFCFSFIDYLQFRKPFVSLYLHHYLSSEILNFENLKCQFQFDYQLAKEKQIKKSVL